MSQDTSFLCDPSIVILALILGLTGCAANIQPAVTQFGTGVIAAQGVETTYIAALNRQVRLEDNLRIIESPKLQSLNKTHNVVEPVNNYPPLPVYFIPPYVVTAITQTFAAVHAYGMAIQQLAGSTANTTFDNNTLALASKASALSSESFMPLRFKNALSTTQVKAVATAVNDVGNMILHRIISRDVKTAAATAQSSLKTIVNALTTVNTQYSDGVPFTAAFISSEAVDLWNHPSFLTPTYGERVSLLNIIKQEKTPVSATAVNNALNALLKANKKIADAGPVNASTALKNLEKAIADAYAAYQSFLPTKS